MACIPTASCGSSGSCAPIENSPPGIHTMPSGAGPGGGCLFSTVGRNPADGATSTGDGVDRVSVKARIAAPAIATAATHANARVCDEGEGVIEPWRASNVAWSSVAHQAHDCTQPAPLDRGFSAGWRPPISGLSNRIPSWISRSVSPAYPRTSPLPAGAFA